jgi:hypothetical protein
MRQAGFVAITSVLIIGVVVLSITLAVSLTAIGEAQQGLALFKGEDGLTFAGGSITRPEGTCTVSISKAGVTWTMDVTTTDTKYKRTVRVVFDRNTTGITLTSWNEI